MGVFCFVVVFRTTEYVKSCCCCCCVVVEVAAMRLELFVWVVLGARCAQPGRSARVNDVVECSTRPSRWTIVFDDR